MTNSEIMVGKGDLSTWAIGNCAVCDKPDSYVRLRSHYVPSKITLCDECEKNEVKVPRV